MKTRVSVREGNTGILYLTYEDGKQERFVPNYDLGEARRWLLTWQDLQDTTGSRLKDNYWREGINWLPTVVNFLHAQSFANYVRYQPLLEQIIDGEFLAVAVLREQDYISSLRHLFDDAIVVLAVFAPSAEQLGADVNVVDLPVLVRGRHELDPRPGGEAGHGIAAVG